jgi:hypothetical protein
MIAFAGAISAPRSARMTLNGDGSLKETQDRSREEEACAIW